MIMSSSIGYLTSRSTFLQVSPEIPITKSRNPDKFDPPEVFEGEPLCPHSGSRPLFPIPVCITIAIRCPHPVRMALCYSLGPLLRGFPPLANKRELVDDLIVKAKQIEVLIQSLPVPEPEETQVRLRGSYSLLFPF